MAEFIMIIVSAVFINNFVVVQFLGICPFLGVSKDFKSALGMGLAVTFVMTITCLITYPIYTFVLVPLGIHSFHIHYCRNRSNDRNGVKKILANTL